MSLQLRYAAVSDTGLVRKGNEDSGYAGPRLLVVADGMGGHAAGELASAAAVSGVLAEELPASTDPDAALRSSVERAGEQLRRMVAARPELEGMGTTLTLLLHAGDRIGVAQVGDSRAYLLREGVLELVTHDQTFVQSLVDEGRISHEEAKHHPQRSLLLQALDGRVEVEPVIVLKTPRHGDRYLLCSDGLTAVVSEAVIRDVLSVGTPREATDRLVDLALRAGAPDNVTVIVADVVDDDGPDQEPVLVGAVLDSEHTRTAGAAADGGPTAHGGQPAGSVEEVEQGRPAGGAGGGRHRHGAPHGLRLLLPLLGLIAVVAVAAVVGYRWTQRQFYVGVDEGVVAIYQGVPEAVAGRTLSHVVERSDVQATALPTFLQSRASETITVADLDEARRVVDVLRLQAASCTLTPTPDGCPTAQSTAPTPGPSATASTVPTTTAPTTTAPTTTAPTTTASTP